MSGEDNTLTIRPIRPEDEPALVDFHERLSEQSVYMRYASVAKLSQRVAHDRLARICFNDYDREIALVAESGDQIVGVARLTKRFGTGDGEFAMLVSDDRQRRGLGTELLSRLVEIGQDEGLERITADILRENGAMQRVARKLGFEIESDAIDDPMVRAVKVLR